MADKYSISPVSSVGYSSGPVEKIRGYSQKEIKEKLKAYREGKAQSEAEKKADEEYLSIFNNPDHLNFTELLERELSKKNGKADTSIEGKLDGDGILA